MRLSAQPAKPNARLCSQRDLVAAIGIVLTPTMLVVTVTRLMAARIIAVSNIMPVAGVVAPVSIAAIIIPIAVAVAVLIPAMLVAGLLSAMLTVSRQRCARGEHAGRGSQQRRSCDELAHHLGSPSKVRPMADWPLTRWAALKQV